MKGALQRSMHCPCGRARILARGGKKLYRFALTLCWSLMLYVEFAQRQDAETPLNSMVHAFDETAARS